jgi:parvulin-like peptidyl-prolyl isomerase
MGKIRKCTLLKTALATPLIFLLCACSAEQAPPADPVVARVGEESISKSAVEKLAAALRPDLRSSGDSTAARREYLQILIDKQLLVFTARQRSLDTTQTFAADLAKHFRNKATASYRAAKLEERLQISTEELQKYFVDNGYQALKLFSRLVVNTREEAQHIQQQLQQGTAFAALVKKHSIDQATADRDGRLGYLNRDNAAKQRIPYDIFSALKPGDISAPIDLGDAFQLVLCNDQLEANFADYRDTLYQKVRRQKMPSTIGQLIEELATEFTLRLQPTGLSILMAQDSQSRYYPKLSPTAAATALYTYAGGQITVGEYIETFRQSKRQPGLGDSLKIVNTAWQWVIPHTLFWMAAQQSAFTESAPMRLYKKDKAGELLIHALRQVIISTDIALSDEMVERYYQDHPEEFFEPAEIWIDELLADDLDQARQLRQRLETGTTFADLAHLSTRPEAVTRQGKLHLHSYDTKAYGDLIRHCLAAEIGELVGPVAVRGGYAVFLLTDRKGGQMLPLEQQRERIEATLRTIEEDRLFDELVKDLRQQHTDKVEIFEAVLAQVQLPQN